MSPGVGTSQVTAGSRGRAHREPQQCCRYTSRRQLIVFHVVIVLKCQQGKGFNEASPVRNARDSSQRPGGVLITGSAETVQPQRASLPDLLQGGWLTCRRSSAPFPLLTPTRFVWPGFAPRRWVQPAGPGEGALRGCWGSPQASPSGRAGARKAQAPLKGEGEGFKGFLDRGLVWAGRAAFGADTLRSCSFPASLLSLYNELPCN